MRKQSRAPVRRLALQSHQELEILTASPLTMTMFAFFTTEVSQVLD
jgi:hypothetical protein